MHTLLTEFLKTIYTVCTAIEDTAKDTCSLLIFAWYLFLITNYYKILMLMEKDVDLEFVTPGLNRFKFKDPYLHLF